MTADTIDRKYSHWCIKRHAREGLEDEGVVIQFVNSFEEALRLNGGKVMNFVSDEYLHVVSPYRIDPHAPPKYDRPAIPPPSPKHKFDSEESPFTSDCNIDASALMYKTADNDSAATSPIGRKDDTGKTDWSILMEGRLGRATEEVVKTLMHGSSEYGRDNWMQVDNNRRRYWSAAFRHMMAWLRGEKIDQKSGCHHLACAVCSLLFLMARE